MTVNSQDIDQIRQLSTQLSTRAGQIEANVSQLTTGLTAVNWRTPEALAFKSTWSDTYLPVLREAVAALREAAQQATSDADDLEQTGVSG